MTLDIRLPELKIQDLLELNRQIKDVYDKLMSFVDAFIELNKCIVEQIQNPNSVFNANLEDYAEAVRDALADLRDTFNNVQSALSNFSANLQGWKDELQNNINSAIQSWQNDISTAMPDVGDVPDLDVAITKDLAMDMVDWIIAENTELRFGINHNGTIDVNIDISRDLEPYILRKLWDAVGQAWKNGYVESDYFMAVGDMFSKVQQTIFTPSYVYNNWSYEDLNGTRKYYYNASYGVYDVYVELYVPKDNPPQFVAYPKIFDYIGSQLINWDTLKSYINDIRTVLNQARDTLESAIQYITDNIPYALNKLCDVLTAFDSAVNVDTTKIEEMRAKLIDSINNLRKCIGLEEISK